MQGHIDIMHDAVLRTSSSQGTEARKLNLKIEDAVCSRSYDDNGIPIEAKQHTTTNDHKNEDH